MKVALSGGEPAVMQIVMAPLRHDNRRVRPDRPRLDFRRQASEYRTALYEDGLPAEVGVAGLSSEPTIPRRSLRPVGHRFHARLQRRMHSAGTGDRQQRKTYFEMRDGTPLLMRLAEVNFIDDKAGKPVGHPSAIGRDRSRRLATRTATSRCCSERACLLTNGPCPRAPR